MRGSLLSAASCCSLAGIIPAHAGLTPQARPYPHSKRDHPRACGAHPYRNHGVLECQGSSPRMRGSLFTLVYDGTRTGIIPAHAGLTFHDLHVSCSSRDHPRACGAHMPFTQDILSAAGSSPRMRGSLFGSLCKHILKGIIPAHAGLTRKKKALKYGDRDHPRACGAHDDFALHCNTESGSSPRMRGSPGMPEDENEKGGIIPAHAGLT